MGGTASLSGAVAGPRLEGSIGGTALSGAIGHDPDPEVSVRHV